MTVQSSTLDYSFTGTGSVRGKLRTADMISKFTAYHYVVIIGRECSFLWPRDLVNSFVYTLLIYMDLVIIYLWVI